MDFKKINVPQGPEHHVPKKAKDMLKNYRGVWNHSIENGDIDDALMVGGLLPEGKLLTVSVDKIVLGKQFRRDVDPESLRELAESIDKDGLIHPPAVVRNEKGEYELVAGYRRFLAMKDLLKKKTIPVIVLSSRRLTEKARLQLAENLKRKDLKPMEVAEAVGELFVSLFNRLGRQEKDGKHQENQEDTCGVDYLQFLKSEEFFRKTSRVSEFGQVVFAELLKETGLSKWKVAVALYLWSQPDDVKKELSEVDLSFKHFLVLMDRGITGEGLVHWAKLAHEKDWSASQLSSQVALATSRKEQQAKPREQKLMQRIYNFATTVKRNKSLKENPELARKVAAQLRKLADELEKIADELGGHAGD